MRGQLEEINYQAEGWLQEKKVLLEQVELLKAKCEDMVERKREEVVSLNEKVDNHIKSEIEEMKKENY
jgi:hypothetical protein